MAGRITGGHVVHMRQDPVPWAYRVLWRKVGLDPDVDRPPAERIVRRRGWSMPVAHVRDGAVVNLYGVGGCPTTVFARAGGRALETKLGPMTEGELRRRTRRIAAGA